MRNLTIILLSLAVLGSCASRTEIKPLTEPSNTAAPSLDANTNSNELINADNNKSKPIAFKKKVAVQISGSILTSDKCKFGVTEYLVELKEKRFSKESIATTAVRPELIYRLEAQVAEGQYYVSLRNNRMAKVITSKMIAVQAVNDKITIDFNGCP